MSRGLLGKKLGMTSLFLPDGRFVPVTVIQAGPCVVTQIKTEATDGYNALQLGFEEKRASRTNKPLSGHFVKSGGTCFSHMREFDVDDPASFDLGQSLGTDLFQVGEKIEVVGTSKGRGFAGVMKRNGFGGGRKTHGSKSHRIPGSVGCSAWPARVFRGKKLPGHYGVDRKTVRNLEIVDIRPDQNLILVKGAVPGSKSGMVQINKPKF
jgi:large subunit ribosomal protein L3